MSFLDKFLDAVKVNDDLDDDDFLDEADDDFEDEKPKKRFFQKIDDDLDEDFDEEPSAPKSSKKDKKEKKAASASKTSKQSRSQKAQSSAKVTPMYSVNKKRSSASSSAAPNNEVCVIKPKQFDESTEIVDALLDNCTVILNLEGLDISLAQHIIDFTAGASYAIEGNIKKVSSYIFILTPEGVDITGDSQEFLNDIAGSASIYEGF